MIQVKKASGELEPFDEEKIMLSLKNAGANPKLGNNIVSGLKKKLYNGMPTQEIYSHVLKKLKNEKYPVSAKYNLKRSIMELGPTGFPFERFVAMLLKHYGYEVKVDVNVFGRCVSHEVDVVAKKKNQHFMVECKFHNQPGIHTDVRVALYVKARFEDISTVWGKKPENQVEFYQAWLVTNTKLTSDAIQFGECAGMKLLGWNYPAEGSLRDLIEDSGLHPITCLFSLSRYQKALLLSQNIVLCRDIQNLAPDVFLSARVSDQQKKKLLEEANAICNHSSA